MDMPTFVSRRTLLSCGLTLTSLLTVSGLPMLHVPAAFAAETDRETPVADLSHKGWPFTCRDAAGRTVTIDAPPKRIIVANYIANYLLVGGAASLGKVVGMTQDGWESTRKGEYEVFSKAFPTITEIPSIGGYHDDILNSEKIIALKPDLLLIGRTQYAANSERIRVFEAAGIRTIVLDYHAMKVENHVGSTEILGRLLERADVALEQCNVYRSSLEETFARIAALPDSQKHRSVYVELGNMGLNLYGNTYNRTILWGAILANISAANIAENNREPYGAATREFVASRNPDVIIIGGSIWNNANAADQMQMGFTISRQIAKARLEAFKTRPLWAALKAVKANEMYAVDHGSLRSMIDYFFTVYLAKVFYPKAFADKDPEAEIVNFYKKYLPEIDPQGTFMLSLKED